MYRRKKMSFIPQLGSMDCGIACLTMIFNYYCCNVDIVDIGSDFFIVNGG